MGSLAAFLLPILLFIIAGGFKHSLSLYVLDNNCQLLFNTSLLTIAISLLIRKIYIIPSFFLMLVVYFDVSNYPIIHNICAAVFFILLTIIIYYSKKYIYFILMMFNVLILYYTNFYFFELIAIYIIIAYNIDVMVLVLKKELKK